MLAMQRGSIDQTSQYGWISPVAAILAMAAILGGCSPSKYAVGNVMVPVLRNARDAAFGSNDIQTFRDAAPSNIFLIEGLLRTDPDEDELRINAAMLYFAYAFSFVEDVDIEYASLLYQKGTQHGYTALAGNKKMPRRPDVSFGEFEAAMPELREKDVPAAVWTAVNWAQFISLHVDSTAVLRDIPKVTSLLERVVELDPDYFEGIPYMLIGALHSFKPPIMGGDPEASLSNFERAFEISGESFLLAKYFFARFYTYRIQDAELFEETLNQVIEAEIAPDDPYQLLNMIAKQKSRVLLGEIDDLF
jgi:hypothetical protein